MATSASGYLQFITPAASDTSVDVHELPSIASALAEVDSVTGEMVVFEDQATYIHYQLASCSLNHFNGYRESVILMVLPIAYPWLGNQ